MIHKLVMDFVPVDESSKRGARSVWKWPV